VKRKFRLNRSTDFKRVRQDGKSYAHPLIVLIALPNDGAGVRLGVAAGRSVGGAVERNKAKRWLREATRPLLPQLHPGWDLILLARRTMADAQFSDVQAAVGILLKRARLFQHVDELISTPHPR
jgi:ribonuclease P protein component